jgi:hypothetical protein
MHSLRCLHIIHISFLVLSLTHSQYHQLALLFSFIRHRSTTCCCCCCWRIAVNLLHLSALLLLSRKALSSEQCEYKRHIRDRAWTHHTHTLCNGLKGCIVSEPLGTRCTAVCIVIFNNRITSITRAGGQCVGCTNAQARAYFGGDHCTIHRMRTAVR